MVMEESWEESSGRTAPAPPFVSTFHSYVTQPCCCSKTNGILEFVQMCKVLIINHRVDLPGGCIYLEGSSALRAVAPRFESLVRETMVPRVIACLRYFRLAIVHAFNSVDSSQLFPSTELASRPIWQ